MNGFVFGMCKRIVQIRERDIEMIDGPIGRLRKKKMLIFSSFFVRINRSSSPLSLNIHSETTGAALYCTVGTVSLVSTLVTNYSPKTTDLFFLGGDGDRNVFM